MVSSNNLQDLRPSAGGGLTNTDNSPKLVGSVSISEELNNVFVTGAALAS